MQAEERCWEPGVGVQLRSQTDWSTDELCAFGKALNLSVPQFLHLRNETSRSAYLRLVCLAAESGLSSEYSPTPSCQAQCCDNHHVLRSRILNLHLPGTSQRPPGQVACLHSCLVGIKPPVLQIKQGHSHEAAGTMYQAGVSRGDRPGALLPLPYSYCFQPLGCL